MKEQTGGVAIEELFGLKTKVSILNNYPKKMDTMNKLLVIRVY